jgi:tRNA dimethylallyltransferase
MESENIDNNRPLIVIVGQTASGKSDLSMEIAKKYNGEIICADSRTVYKGMDIGTAKPSVADREAIRHHVLDIIEPSEVYSASDFKRDAISAFEDIYSRGKLPVAVGGTGLYVNSLVYDFDFGKPPDSEARRILQGENIRLLQERVKQLGLKKEQINFRNKRHLIRAIENKGVVRTRKQLRKDTLLLGLQIEKDELKQRIKQRNEKMIKTGLETEVRNLVGKYGWGAPGLNAIAYKEWREYFASEQDINEVKENMFKDNWQYARRQKIWFKRDSNIYWSTSVEDLIRQVDQFLIQY